MTHRSTVRGVLITLVVACVPVSLKAQIATTGSPHGSLPRNIECTTCHATGATSWKTSRASMRFDHSRATRFDLTGRHADLECRQCHLDLKWSDPKVSEGECSRCHFDVHRGNLSDDCRSCHTTEAFTEVPGVSIHAKTALPLTGSHLQLTCDACHTNGQAGTFFGTLDADCFACHEADYTAAALVDHAAAGFPTDCRQCHETLTWTGGTVFNHIDVSNGFDLIGAHEGMRCANCHIPPAGTLRFAPSGQNDCIACHRSAYDREHGGSGFPTDCLLCHTVESFSGASFADHDTRYFPITTGRHAGTWNDCTTCHSVPGDFTAFSCFACHEHSQTRADDQHSGVSGYRYESAECLRCHPNGRA